MTANLCIVPANLCLNGDDCRKMPCSLANFLDSGIENGSLDEFLKKNDFDPEWVMTQEIKGNFSKAEQKLQLLHLTKKSSSWCSSSFPLPWENGEKRATVTKSFSDIESTDGVENICMEQFEMFNVSMPELISGHVCQDACVCFCNRKLKQANKLRHVILMCTSLAKKNSSNSTYVTTSSASLQSTPMSSSLSSLTRLSRECTASKLHNSFHESSGKCCRSWKFCDDSAIVEIRCAKKGRHRHHSCPMESYRFISMFNAGQSLNAFDPTLLNQMMRGSDLGCEEFISLRRIQNEISVIQLKHSIINKDYSRRKWAKFEERKLVQSFGRIDDKTRIKKLEQIDYELLKLGEKFREDSEAIKQLFNREHGKLIELYSKYENSLEASLDKIDSNLASNGLQASMTESGSEECGKNCMKSETLKQFKNLEPDLWMKSINNQANQMVRVESLVKNGDDHDDVFQDESKNRVKNEDNSLGSCSSTEGQHVLASFSRFDGSPFIQLRSTHQLKNRPLTRYLPIKGEATNFDLRLFIEQGGHCLDLCQEIKVTSHCAYGFLKKIGRRLKTWRRKWFVFDRNQKQLCYYSDRSELLLKGRISFQVIEDVYIDNSMLGCANNKATFCLKTLQKAHILSAPSTRARQIWMDVLFTGAEAYQDYLL